MIYLILFAVFFAVMLIYFRIADRYNIIDHPNERSSHSEITIRGGGIIFPFVAIMVMILYPEYWMPALGAILIGIISFADDRLTLSSKIRLVVHVIAVTLMLIFLNVFHLPLYWPVVLYILAIGIINVYNFMDGINGITGLYTLVILGGIQYVNLQKVSFIEADLIWFPILACVVFLYFNFRKKAKCFAGDVGSVTIAFWIVMLLLKLILQSGNWSYLLFLSVYGVDSVLTIVHRLMRKENIFKAHRLHFYQLLANEHKMPHLLVATIYALIQMVIIAFVVLYNHLPVAELFIISLSPLLLVYLLCKPRLMKFNLSSR